MTRDGRQCAACLLVDAVGLLVILAWVLFAHGGCAAAPVVEDRRIVQTVRFDCLPKDAPRLPAIKFDGPESGCPEAFEVCLRREAAVELARYLVRADLWIRAAVVGCGVGAATGPGIR